MANKRKQEKLNNKKKIGLFIPIEGGYEGKMDKLSGFLYTLMMALILSLGISSAYLGMSVAIDVNVDNVLFIFVVAAVTVALSFCRSYLRPIWTKAVYALVVLADGIFIYMNQRKLINCLATFGDKYMICYMKYMGREDIGSAGYRDITILFIVVGILCALLAVGTARTSYGTVVFIAVTLPCVIACMIVGTVPGFVWFVIYSVCLVGISCAEGIVGDKNQGKQWKLVRPEDKALKGKVVSQNAEQIETGAYVKIMCTAMVVALLVMLTTALVYPKRDYEEKEAEKLKGDMEDKLLDLENYINDLLNSEIDLVDKVKDKDKEKEPNFLDGYNFPNLSLSVDKLKSRIKNGGGMGFGVIPEGKIKLDATKPRLEVTVGKLDSPLYLKGYVADTYENGRWIYAGIEFQDISYIEEILRNSEGVGFYSPRQNIVIKNVGEKSDVDFMPYFIKESAYAYQYSPQGGVVSRYSGNGYFSRYDISLDDITSTSFNFANSDWSIICHHNGLYVTDDEFMVFNHQYLADNFADEYRKDLVQSWIDNGYVTDVKNSIIISNEKSLNVTEEELYDSNVILPNSKPEINMQIINNVKFVQNYLANNMTYTLEPPKNTTGLDSASYFLKESKKGYCMHFATSGALLLAEMGVPVRYVEGYVLTEENYKKAKLSDSEGEAVRTGGDCVAEAGDVTSEMYTVVAYGANAHAWVEVYLMGMGWVPVEMTKTSASGNGFESVIGDAFTGDINPPEETKSPEASKNPEETNKPEETKNPEETKAPQETKAPSETESSDNENQGEKLSPLVLGVIIGGLTLIALISACIIYRKAKKARIRTMLSTKRGTLKYIFGTIEMISAKKGIVYENNIRYDDYGRLMSEIYECLEEKQAIEYMAAISKELFSKEGITQQEFEMIKDTYKLIVDEVIATGNKFYVFYLKNIKMIQQVI